MSLLNELTAIIIMICLLLFMGSFIGTPHNLAEKQLTSSGGVEHKIEFINKDNILIIESYNPTDWENKISGYVVSVDNQRVYDKDLRLDSNESHTQRINLTPGINVNQDNHTVTFSTYGNHTQFNFTREIDSSDPGAIPTPKITDVEVTDGTIQGQESVVANVTLANPSEQLYSTKLMVHTVGTDGSLYPASVRPGDTRTITVELLDERGRDIAGEARLYTGNMSTEDGAIDQVEFAGNVEGDTSVWDTSYEPVRPTWMDDNYEYENASYERSIGAKLSRGREVGGIPIAYFVAALVVGIVGLRKVR